MCHKGTVKLYKKLHRRVVYVNSQEIAVTPWSITVFATAHLWSLSWDMNPVHTFPSIQILSSNLRLGLRSVLFSFPDQNFICISHLSDGVTFSACSHPPWFDYPNNIWRSVQVMKLLIIQYFLASCLFLRLSSICSPQHPLLKRPQYTPFPCERHRTSHETFRPYRPGVLEFLYGVRIESL